MCTAKVLKSFKKQYVAPFLWETGAVVRIDTNDYAAMTLASLCAGSVE